MPPITFSYSSGATVTFDGQKISVHTQGENTTFGRENKPVFSNATGESVVELSGLATDKRADRSWALADYTQGGYSELHFHNERTENYYVTQGQAKVIRNNEEHLLSPGEMITIEKGDHHQVTSVGEKPLQMLVVCTPSWIFEDQHFVTQENIARHSPSP